ncbi:MAG: DUF3616 domain-containing protein [Variovorax sp.]|nr:MAG: DUF3616 domain-containing protein [Variovorax sp.]
MKPWLAERTTGHSVKPASQYPQDAATTWLDNASVAQKDPPAFQPMNGLYEPSAIQQLPDGRFLVVEDEKHHPFSLVAIGVDGSIDSTELTAGLLQIFSDFWKLDDLEGLALDRAGFIYAITSHSRDDEGNEKKSRERLVRFRIEGSRVVDPKVVDGLKRAMTAKHPLLASAARIRDVKAGGGLNIEALEISPDRQRLLIGFRSPLHDGRAIIASVENPTGIFEADEAPRLAADLDELDLDGHGIRGLSYVPSIGEYLVISGPVSREPGQFALWRWKGPQGGPARRVTVPGLQGLERAEGVSPAVIDGVERIIIVSDDGDRKTGRSASYLLLDLDQLQTAP